MAFNPILSDLAIGDIRYNTNYRNAFREQEINAQPVYFTPSYLGGGVNDSGFAGPRYKRGFTYNNCPTPERNYNGNCTWWCCGRLQETLGKRIFDYFNDFTNINASNWYNIFTGDKEPNANNIRSGDIIVLTDGGDGHVMFVEEVRGSTVYISQSAYSLRDCWNGYACRVTNYDKSEIRAGLNLDMYKGIDTPYIEEVIGVLHTGEEPQKRMYIPIIKRLMDRRKRGRLYVKLFR